MATKLARYLVLIGTGVLVASQISLSAQVQAVAEAAKKAGQTKVSTYSTVSDDNSWAPASDFVRAQSSLLVVPTDTEPITEIISRDIFTWRVVKIVDVLRGTAPHPTLCVNVAPPKGLVVKKGEASFVEWGGVMNIDGVEVTQTTPDSAIDFKPGLRYLVIADLCGVDGNHIIRPHTGDIDVFEILPNGSFAPRANAVRPLEVWVFSTRDLAGFTRALKSIR